MSQPGWYLDPDPQAPPGRLRWWDGARWSDATHLPSPVPPPAGVTAHDPTQPYVPTSGHSTAMRPGGAGGPERRRRTPLTGILAALLVLALLGGVLWWRHSRPTGAPEDQNSAAPTVSAWNESASPTPSASSSGVRPSASGKPLRQVPCPRTAPPRGSHPNDGRLHGGGLVVDLPRTFKPTPFIGMDFVGDRGAGDRALTPGRKVSLASVIVVGSLDRKKFGSLDTAAQSVLTCVYSYARDNHMPVSEHVLVDEATTLQGHPAWHLKEEVSSFKATKPEWIEEVEVVDLGGQQYGLLWSSALTADPTAVKLLGDSRATLTVGR